jgi:peptidoglycan/xylan/chitin deacetylase (PgdA/CDA1 family)
MRIFLGLVLVMCIALPMRGQSRSVAITIDDLPCANCAPVGPDGSPRHGVLEATNERLIARLASAKIPVTGFVVTQTADQAGTAEHHALELWLDAGFDLGSHSYSHPNFADISEAEMEAEISRADATLKPMLAAKGRKLQFFRFPYNDTGDTQAKHDAVAGFLRDHGYQVATCTMEASDYVFAAAYARALGANDTTSASRIRQEYLTYTATEIDFYAALNRRVLGYEPPEVMLLHDSLLNADSIDEVLALFRTRGYRFVNLAEAQQDPAYAIPDTYITRYGPMWGYRWARERNLGKLNLHESEPPEWITRYADGEK